MQNYRANSVASSVINVLQKPVFQCFIKRRLIDPFGHLLIFKKRGRILHKIINSQYAWAYINRSLARFAVGDQQGARKDWKRAKEIDPNISIPPIE